MNSFTVSPGFEASSLLVDGKVDGVVEPGANFGVVRLVCRAGRALQNIAVACAALDGFESRLAGPEVLLLQKVFVAEAWTERPIVPFVEGNRRTGCLIPGVGDRGWSSGRRGAFPSRIWARESAGLEISIRMRKTPGNHRALMEMSELMRLPLGIYADQVPCRRDSLLFERLGAGRRVADLGVGGIGRKSVKVNAKGQCTGAAGKPHGSTFPSRMRMWRGAALAMSFSWVTMMSVIPCFF